MNGRTSPLPRSIEHPRLLLGEGREEETFFTAYLGELGIANVQVESYGGKSKLASHLRALVARPGFAQLQSVVITRDADEDAEAATQSVRSAIEGAGFPSELSVRTFVLPSHSAPGALEDLCLSSLTGTPIENCVNEFFVCASRAFGRSLDLPATRAKARIHAWLATQDPPDLRLGEAAAKRLVDFSSPAFLPLRNLLLDAFR